MPGVSAPPPLRLRDLLAGVCLRLRPAAPHRRKPWAIRNVRDEDKMLTAEVTK